MEWWMWLIVAGVFVLVVAAVVASSDYYAETRPAEDVPYQKTPSEIWTLIQWYTNVNGARDNAIVNGLEESEMNKLDLEWEKAKSDVQIAIGFVEED